MPEISKSKSLIVMAKLIYITGGQRSGKSSFAQQLALQLSARPLYLATSRLWDQGHKERIHRHRADRGPAWDCIEEELAIGSLPLQGRVVLLDCITLWLTNYFFDNGSSVEISLQLAKEEFEKLMQIDCTILAVSNEIGLGGHPANELQMKFTDLQGWMNQHIAAISDEAYLLVSGLRLKIK
jgi:adenosylcobinamide kinase / adenosylcobinamide-phosphate guanylyltransferase